MARELWMELKNKYETEDATNQSFLVNRLYDWRMFDFESVLFKFMTFNYFSTKLFLMVMLLTSLPLALFLSYIRVKRILLKSWHKRKKALNLQQLIKFLQIKDVGFDKIEVNQKKSKDCVVENKLRNNGKKKKIDDNDNSG